MLADAWPAFWRHGQWNELRARIVGVQTPTVTTWINGVKISQWKETENRHPARGRVALQIHGGSSPQDYDGKFVRYRDGFARNRGVLSPAISWNTIRSSRDVRASPRAACRR